ncbi:uncharacterized protein M421DRAFT_1174 [Didymella exigua CBS 183.55]|uniref:DUF3669 domain-containing protein n=1 Tax=Didymella exigua CBS 183.55 TaxID=1150837 RepID=A0A6A5RZ81_9PLEO|nr:uncharacterized protein M421DRAFT_1174 [Didymella exigua CBS 183.55]KAF1932544.1 hypothetical protein M421DRAFT_1174 [Didymella exigua CBS 183.55]
MERSIYNDNAALLLPHSHKATPLPSLVLHSFKLLKPNDERYLRTFPAGRKLCETKDEDCLMRLYCGKRRSAYDRLRQKWFFMLRNYGLCVDQMEDLGVDIDRAVQVLARALVSCYWVARTDAEWVFGLPRAEPVSQVEKQGDARIGRNQGVFDTHSQDREVFNMKGGNSVLCEDMVVWRLDFDCVQPMTTDHKGVQQAVHTFYRKTLTFLVLG